MLEEGVRQLILYNFLKVLLTKDFCDWPVSWYNTPLYSGVFPGNRVLRFTNMLIVLDLIFLV